MKNYETLIEDYYILKEFVKKYETELKIIGGIIGERRELISYEDYMKFINGLNQDEFTGNYFGFLLNDVGMNHIKNIMKMDDNFDNYVRMSLIHDDDLYEKYNEKLKLERARA